MADLSSIKRLNAIVDGASQLPTENQMCILCTIRGMLFTASLMRKKYNIDSDKTEMAQDFLQSAT